MPVAFRDAQSAGIGASNSTTVTMPTYSSGDFILAVVFWRDSADDVSTPSGYTLYHTNNPGGASTSTIRTKVYYKIATGSEGNVQFSGTGSSLTSVNAYVATFSNPEGTPIDIIGSSANGASSSMTTPSVSATTAGLLISTIMSTTSGTWNAPSPASTVRVTQNQSSNKLHMATRQLSSSGATGTTTWEHDATGTSTGITLVLAASSSTPVTVNADVTNVSIDAQDTTVTAVSNHTSNADVTNIAIAGQAASITTTKNVSQTATTSDITVAGQAATVTATNPNVSVSATTASITLNAEDAAVAAGGSIVVQAPTSDIDVGGQTASTFVPVGAELLAATARTFETGISGWNIGAGATNLIRTTQASNSGSYSMRFTTDTGQPTATIYSDTVAVDPDDTYTFQGFVFADGKQLHIDFYNSSNVLVQTNSTSIMPNTGSFYYLMWVQAQPPATATYLRLRIFTEGTAGAHTYADDLSLLTSASTGVTIQPSGSNITANGQAATPTQAATINATAATITVDALDAEVTTMPDAVHVTVGTDTTNLGVDAWDGDYIAQTPIPVSFTEHFSDGTLESWITKSGNGSISGGKWIVIGDYYVAGNGTLTVTAPTSFVGTVNVTIAGNYSESGGTSSGAAIYNGPGTSQDQTLTFPTNTSWSMTKTVLPGEVFTLKATTTHTTNDVYACSTSVDYITLSGTASIPTLHYSVVPDEANVNITGKTAILNTEVHPTPANISILMGNHSISTPGQVRHGADTGLITISGKDADITTTRSITMLPIVANISVNNQLVDIRTMEDSFKFIPAIDSSFTAADADELTAIHLGALLHNQQKFQAFKIGNVGGQPIGVTLSIVSVNSDLDDLVQLSTDKHTYSSTIQLNAIPPNGISDPVWFRINSASASPGAGSFLINVEQTNA